VIGVRPTANNDSSNAFIAQWREIVDDPSLQDLPYKIETDEWGRIILSPHSRPHARYAFRIALMLEQLQQSGEGITEAPVLTRKGIRVPDAGWVSERRTNDDGDEIVFTRAPEICVEVISKSNKPKEIKEKTALYFEAGALEVWTCDQQGNMKFADPDGVLEQSKLVPTFPSRVDLKR
jgi:Uma2 family endonuclease